MASSRVCSRYLGLLPNSRLRRAASAWLVLVWLAALLCTASCDRSTKTELAQVENNLALASGEQAVQRCREVYRSCRTYRDEGTAQSLVIARGERLRTKGRFSTLFRRTGGYRFEYEGERFRGEQVTYSIWSLGDGPVKTRWNGRFKEHASVTGELNAANGVCDATPCLVGRFLFPDFDLVGTDVLRFEELEKCEEATVGGFRCLRVKGRQALPPVTWPSLEGFPKSVGITLWIDQQSYLLRKIHTLAVSDTVRMESSYDLEPRVDDEISDEELEPR